MPIPEREIEVTFYRSGGPGGQKKNVTESAVRVRHIPTGITAVSTRSRSQHQNKELALAELERRLAQRRRRRKPRHRTRPTSGSQERRLEEKKRRGGIKQMREPPEAE